MIQVKKDQESIVNAVITQLDEIYPDRIIRFSEVTPRDLFVVERHIMDEVKCDLVVGGAQGNRDLYIMAQHGAPSLFREMDCANFDLRVQQLRECRDTLERYRSDVMRKLE